MGSLLETIKDPARRRVVVDDCEALIKAEVADKKGLTGMAVKAAFKAVQKFRPGIVPMAMNHLLDDFAQRIDPIWKECQASGEPPRSFLSKRKVDVAEALLGVTDDRARRSPNKALVKAYNSLRPKAIEHIGASMPRFADLLVKHAS